MLLEDLKQTLASGEAVVVAGAGLAVGASGRAPVAAWRGLLEDGIARCVEVAQVPDGWAKVQHDQLDLDDVESWLAVAEQVTLRLGGRDGGEFRRWLHETVGALKVDTGGRALVDAVVGLGVPVCTTNYDGLIEEVAGTDPVTWRDGPRALQILRGGEPGIVHLHGYWRDPASAILGVRSYEEVLGDGSAQAMLRALATMRSLVLVGFGSGLEDPNFRALRAWMADTWSGAEHRHFRLVRECERDAVLAAHSEDERVLPVVYGKDHEDLEPFLRDLAAGRRVKSQPSRESRPASSPGTLPALRPFFGRDDVVERLVAVVLDANPQPVPILGAPGIGKSALALACVHDRRVAERFSGRRVWVRCDGSLNASGLVADLAAALGISGADALAEAVIGYLEADPTLVVLDNAETPWIADMPGTEEFLAQLAAVSGIALVCSFRGVHRPLGPRWADSILVPPLESEPAEQVFLAAAGDRFVDDPALAALLSDLDGMPIAIELLGRLAQPEENLDGLRRRWEGRRTNLLRAGTDPDRHLSVAVSFELSISDPSLDDDVRRLLTLLAQLADGVALENLDAVFPHGEDYAAALRGAGLAFEEAGRLRVLKPIRDHVASHHPVSGDDAKNATAHYLGLAHRLGPMVGAEGGATASATLTGESANLIWAITAALADDPPTAGIDAALAVTELGRLRGLAIEHLTERARERANDLGDLEREVRALFHLGLLAAARSDDERARESYELALPLYREAGDVLGEANCIKGIADIALERSDHAGARERYEQALPLYREVADVVGEANCIARLGDLALARSDHDAARKCYEEALPLYRKVGNVLGETNCIKSLGDIALERSDLDGARERYEQALPLYRKVGDVRGEANCIKGLADIALEQSDLDGARERYDEALPLYSKVGSVLGVANCIKGLGDIAFEQPDYDGARARYEEALPLYSKVGAVLGEANCIQRLGDVALKGSDLDGARERYEHALNLFESIAEPYSIGMAHLRLTDVSGPDALETHLAASRAAWRSIGREDLVARLAPD